MLNKMDSIAPGSFEKLIDPKEAALINHLAKFNQVVQNDLEKHATHILCQYTYQLAKLYNSFYADCSVANADTDELKAARKGLSMAVSQGIKTAMSLLGIEVPTKM